MRLYATPLSHYSRKVRLLLDHYGIEHELVHPGEVSGADAARFGGNPIMKVPVLEDGETWLIESEHIAQHIVRGHDAADRYRVLDADPHTLNLRAMMNGIMQEEVKLILAARTGVETAELPFFRKARVAIENGLEWLETRADRFDAGSPAYLEFHLVCLMDHLEHFRVVPLEYPSLRAIVGRVSESEITARSSPGRSLERYARTSAAATKAMREAVELSVERNGKLIVARLRGEPTVESLQECQERVLSIARNESVDKVLYDALEMTAPSVDVPWSQRALDDALTGVHLRRAIVVPDSKLAFLARLAFGEGDYRVFYNDIPDAVEWLLR